MPRHRQGNEERGDLHVHVGKKGATFSLLEDLLGLTGRTSLAYSSLKTVCAFKPS